MITSVSRFTSDPCVLLCCCTFSSLHCDSFLSLTSSLNYHCFHIPPSCFDPGGFSSIFCSLPLPLSLSSADPPPIPWCRIITTSPEGQTSALCISSTRTVDREATTASSRRRRCSRTGPEPSTLAFTSQTGSPRPPSLDQTAHTRYSSRDREIETGGVGVFSDKPGQRSNTAAAVDLLYNQLGRVRSATQKPDQSPSFGSVTTIE